MRLQCPHVGRSYTQRILFFKQACCKKYYNIHVSATSVKYSNVVVITTEKRTQLLTILLMFAIV